jgi:hypothetical protein
MTRARPFRQTIAGPTLGRVAAATSLLLVAGVLAGTSPAGAAPVAAQPVVLGTAAQYSVLAGPSVTSTGAGTVLALDLGVTGTVAGFPPGTVTGAIHVGDAAVKTAHTDRQAAYESIVAQTDGTPFSGDIAGKTFTPGLHSATAAITNTGTITLDAAGDPGAIFVFQMGAALSSAASTKVVLKNGALANNVYWQVTGAVALGAGVEFVGTILGAGAISFGAGASLKGRALGATTVALADSPITQPIDDFDKPLVTIDGGATGSTSDTTPRISGTTDEPGTPLVTVRIGSQVLTARAAGGLWTVSAGTLSAATHTVDASVADPSGNVGTATQALTVDTSAPVVTIAGGASAATNDTTPIISGTTDEPGSPVVTVTVGGQTLTTTAADGRWSVQADALTETAHLVEALVSNDADVYGTGHQVLTIDVTVPVLTIDGGSSRSTADTSPWTYGTTAERAGTIVRVEIGAQSLAATVQSGGTWGVSAQSLDSGTYRVLATITDAAANSGSTSQTLQVGSVVTEPVGPPPAVAFDAGAAKETTDTTPTISGTTLVPNSPTVVVTVGGQTLITTADDDGAWSVTVEPLTEGPHTIVVRVTDATGNTTSTTQALTVSSVAPPAAPPVAAPVAPPAAAPSYRPDAEIRLAKRPFVGRGSDSVARQRVTSTVKGSRAKASIFGVRVTNRGSTADRMRIRGTRGSKQLTVVYRDGRKNVTAAVLAGTYRTRTLRPGQSVTLSVTVTKVKRAAKGSRRTFSVRTTSASDRTKADTVAAVVVVARG